MDLNSIMAVITVLVLGAIFFQHWRITRAVAHMIGMEAPDTGSVDGGIGAVPRIYYFYRDGCRFCRTIAPMVDAMAAEHPNLIRIDVGEHLELASRFHIMGTPTFIAVADGHISDVKLESPSRAWLQSHLE